MNGTLIEQLVAQRFGFVLRQPVAIVELLDQGRRLLSKNWPAGAYSPLTNMMYFPLQNMCQTATTTTDQRDPTKVYGLSMVQQIVSDHRGTVDYVSDLGKGTTFRVSLPIS